ncbi:MAG: L-serine ammonia-lyase, iron-sulfur-dependent subunit beta, partial [Clostridia bacterium]|nr:L-serine ammonia-lyase, iron-sulfur-dependent subunit beta [Clostridia bacterium]
MRGISVFDIIGPIMIGPSSSHTAGACRIAKVASRIAGEQIVKVNFLLFGSFSKTYRGHGTDRALVAGILGMSENDERIRDSFDIAKESGLEFNFDIEEGETDFHPNTVEITMTTVGGEEVFVRGSSIGGGEIEINNINGAQLQYSGKNNAVMVTQEDTPGVIADVSTVLAKHGINIALLNINRENKGDIGRA